MKALKASLLGVFIYLTMRLIVFIGQPDCFRVGEKKIDRFLEKITARH